MQLPNNLTSKKFYSLLLRGSLVLNRWLGFKVAIKEVSMNKYGPKAQQKIEDIMHEYKAGKLKSGRSGEKVKDRRQAVAIGISEARKRGYKVPPEGQD